LTADREYLNKAIVLYLGFGSAKFPQRDADRVVTEFGRTAGISLVARVDDVIAELKSIEVDWKKNTLVTGGKVARDEMHHRHPGLSGEALDALYWKFTFDWR
jgi:hypothetical protein